MGSNPLAQLDDPLSQGRVVDGLFEVPLQIWVPVATQDLLHKSFSGPQIVIGVPELFRNPHILCLGKVQNSDPFWHDGMPQDALMH